MIRSMTAFAGAERATRFGTLACELRAVNHRYLDLSVRLPDDLRALEPRLRERVAARVARGKLDLGFRFRAGSAAGADLRLDPAVLARLSQLASEVVAGFSGMRVEFTELLRFPGVLIENETDRDGLHAEAMAVLDEALDAFVATREREGAMLARGLRDRLDAVAAIAASIRTWLPDIRAGLRQRLATRLAEFSHSLDPGRLEQELVLWLQKIDVDEELDRLDAHIAEAQRVLALDEAVGRRMDFLLQEFNREANTLGSKSVDARTSRASVELKVLIEQIREQVQNVE
ncbi:MAG TPA: YicC family protein [Xanthomonadales bacterium]|nr:YicC family protein [Xanthomonadales bacterium]